MKNIILKSSLIALCLICGLGNAWGETTATLTFTAACGGSGTDSQGNTWTVTSDADESTYDVTKGIHYGTGKKAVSHLTLTCSKISGTITTIVVNASGASGTSATLKATVGGTDFGTQNQSLTSSNAAYTFSGSASGDIVITASQTSATKALYVKSIEVTYSSGTTKTLSSIAVKNAPTKTTYTEGENFDPAGLVITATYSDSDPEDIAYSGNESDFSFSPALTTALTTSNTSVTITYGGKSTAQSITVNEKPKHTAYFSINGTINDAYDCTVTEGSAITFPTGLADINGKKFVGWMEGTISGTADTAPDFVTSATMGTSDVTYYAVYAESEETEPTQYTAGETGNYVLAVLNDSKWYALPNNPTVSSGKITGVEISVATSSSSVNYVTASNASGYTWTITNATHGQTISDGSKYIYHSNGGNIGTNLAYGSSTSYTWKIELETNGLTFKAMDGSKVNGRGLLANGTTFGGYSLTNADGTGYYRIHVLPIAGTTYSGYCTTVPTSGPTDASWAVTPDAVSVEVGKTATATISTNYDGTLSVSSNATGTATATISGKTITVTGVAAGTTTLTVTGAATSNFNAISKTIDVTVTASSATTPAFAYFEETATINVGEILEAKDYCGTIAPDAGFDDYSISTAVCSAIGAADGQKISDDYACIYSKVSFKKAGTYVVHVTAPAVAGKYTASEGYITVTVTGPTLYKVTIETPENGTLIVKHGDDIVESGDEFEEGEKLQITATPDADYKFRNWQAYDGTTHTFTTSFEWEMSAHDVTLTANFDEIQDYTIAWSVNGKIVKSETLEEGTEVVPVQPTDDLFTAAVSAGVTKVFTGWVTTPTVDANATPSYVTPAATATKDVTYYAVFATEEEGTGSVDKTAAFNVANYADANNWTNATAYYFAETEELRIDEGHTATTATNNGKYYTTDETWRFYKSEGGSFTVTSLKGDMKSITITFVPKDSSKKWPKLIHNEVEAASGEQITDISGNTAVFFVGGDGGNIGIQNIEVVYVGTGTTTTYSDFTTLVSCEISISQYGATSFSVPRNYTMPTGITGKTITANKKVDSLGDGYYKLTYSADYEEGSVVPAGESLVLYGEQGNYTIIYEGTPEKTLKEGNLLHSVYEAQDGKFLTTYDKEHSGSYYYYKLTTQSGENFGWYYGATEGAPFLMSRDDRAYLVIEKEIAAGIRGFALEDGEEEDLTTGIDNMETNSTNSIYNLQGVQQSKLQKGINIVNGKKVIR